MSLLPYFGVDPDELVPHWRIAPMMHGDLYRPVRSMMRAAHHLDAGSNVAVDKDKYQLSVDVHQFAPEEIIVKTIGDQVVVEAKHEEKQDEHGYVSRHFVRKYHLPHDHKAEDVVSSLSSDGVLTITAPRKKVHVDGERLVPIQSTGHAHKSIKQKPAAHAHY